VTISITEQERDLLLTLLIYRIQLCEENRNHGPYQDGPYNVEWYKEECVNSIRDAEDLLNKLRSAQCGTH
jgi:hypothetical protein